MYGAVLLLLQLRPQFVFKTIFTAGACGYPQKMAASVNDEMRPGASCCSTTSSTGSVSRSSRLSSTDGECNEQHTFNSGASTTSADRFSRVFGRARPEGGSDQGAEVEEEDLNEDGTDSPPPPSQEELVKCRSISQVVRLRPEALQRFVSYDV